MSKINIDIPHKGTQEEATAKVKTLLAEAKGKLGDKVTNLKEDWAGNTCSFGFTVSGQSISGTIEVTAADIKVEAGLPWALSLFKGQIEKAIKEHAKDVMIR